MRRRYGVVGLLTGFLALALPSVAVAEPIASAGVASLQPASSGALSTMVMIGDLPVRMVIDSHLSRSAITAELAARLQAPPHAQALTLPSLTVAGVVSREALSVAIMSREQATRLQQKASGAAGILGDDWLRRQPYEIDHRANVFRWGPALAGADQQGVVLPFVGKMGELSVVALDVDGEPGRWWLFPETSEIILLDRSPLAERWRGRPFKPDGFWAAVIPTRSSPHHRFTAGGQELGSLTVKVTGPYAYDGIGDERLEEVVEDFHGILGSLALTDWRLVVDWPGKRLILIRRT